MTPATAAALAAGDLVFNGPARVTKRLADYRLRRLMELADRADRIAVEGENARDGSAAQVMHEMRDVIRAIEDDNDRCHQVVS